VSRVFGQNPTSGGNEIFKHFANYQQLGTLTNQTTCDGVCNALFAKGFKHEIWMHLRREDELIAALNSMSFGSPWTIHYPFGSHRAVIMLTSDADAVMLKLRMAQ
jgi:hypothetical protein